MRGSRFFSFLQSHSHISITVTPTLPRKYSVISRVFSNRSSRGTYFLKGCGKGFFPRLVLFATVENTTVELVRSFCQRVPTIYGKVTFSQSLPPFVKLVFDFCIVTTRIGHPLHPLPNYQTVFPVLFPLTIVALFMHYRDAGGHVRVA